MTRPLIVDICDSKWITWYSYFVADCWWCWTINTI